VLEPDEWTDGDSFRVRLPDNAKPTGCLRGNCAKRRNVKVGSNPVRVASRAMTRVKRHAFSARLKIGRAKGVSD
jgi:hypothetical protein